MNLRPSNFWFDGACFKCTHYIIGQGGRLCTKHNTEIHGDCDQKCDDYALSKDRWHDETTQAWEWLIQQQVKRKVKEFGNPQTSMDRWCRWESTSHPTPTTATS